MAEYLDEELDILGEIEESLGRSGAKNDVKAQLDAMDDEEREALKELAADRAKAPAEPAKEPAKPAADAPAPGLTAAARAQLGTAKPAETKPAADEPKFDIKKYAEKFGEDPVAAQDYLDQFAQGPRKLKGELDEVRTELKAREVDAYLDFVDANPDFPSEDKDLVGYLESVTRSAKMSITKRNLAQAWKYLKDQKLAVGKVTAEAQPEKEKSTNSSYKEPAQKVVAPRAKGRSASTGATGAIDEGSDKADRLMRLIENTDDLGKLNAEFERIGLNMPGSLSRFSGGTGPIN